MNRLKQCTGGFSATWAGSACELYKGCWRPAARKLICRWNNCCNEYRANESNPLKGYKADECNRYSADRRLEPRPGSFRCRVQGQAHDDFQRKREVQWHIRLP